MSRHDLPRGFPEKCALRIGALVCLCLLLLGCGASATPSEVTVRTLSIRSLYPEALKIARDWKEDAYLVQARVSFGAFSADEYQNVSFYFRSLSTNIIGLYLRYDPATDSFRDEWLSIHAVEPERESQINDSEWQIDSNEALKIAQSHGGSEFLTGRSAGDLHLYLRLEKHQDNGLPLTVWFVAYYDRTGGEELFVVIDAMSGEVID